ncbi:hypothetical protein ANO14919_014140 [Xylariales sp. No.14919]|nr:hypothetical protein ANO14919_014140 [Xylariales sp. No.14919]
MRLQFSLFTATSGITASLHEVIYESIPRTCQLPDRPYMAACNALARPHRCHEHLRVPSARQIMTATPWPKILSTNSAI